MKLAYASRLVGVLAVGLLAAACDKSGQETQQKRAEAEQELTQAQVEATKKVYQAQAKADQKIEIANADFTKSVADYRATRQKDLAGVDKSIADLTVKEESATGRAKTNLDAALPGIRAQRDALSRQMQLLDTTTAPSFDSLKMSIDKTFDDLKSAIRSAS